MEFIDYPKVHPVVWKKIIQNPEVCNPNSMAFREKLPLESEEDNARFQTGVSHWVVLLTSIEGRKGFRLVCNWGWCGIYHGAVFDKEGRCRDGIYSRCVYFSYSFAIFGGVSSCASGQQTFREIDVVRYVFYVKSLCPVLSTMPR
jgi:hypothetical protein